MSVTALLGGYNATSSGEVNVRIAGFSRLDFDRAPIRKALRLEGNLLRDVARSLVRGAPTSSPGEFPGRRTGTLGRSIKTRTSKTGFAAFVNPQKTARMGKYFYPAFLAYGVKSGSKVGRLAPGEGRGRSNRRASGARAAAIAARAATGWRLAPRGDYMLEALARRRVAATEAIRLALENSMVPRR